MAFEIYVANFEKLQNNAYTYIVKQGKDKKKELNAIPVSDS